MGHSTVETRQTRTNLGGYIDHVMKDSNQLYLIDNSRHDDYVVLCSAKLLRDRGIEVPEKPVNTKKLEAKLEQAKAKAEKAKIKADEKAKADAKKIAELEAELKAATESTIEVKTKKKTKSAKKSTTK